MTKTNAIKLLVTSDIHYGNDHTYVQRGGPLAGQTCSIKGSWGNAVMPSVINLFKTDGYDLLLDIGDRHSAYPAVLASGRLPTWIHELSKHFEQAGQGKFLDVKGNHCGELAQNLGYPSIPRNQDFPSGYKDINGFRIVQSNAGTRQLSSVGRFFPPEHLRWMEDVIGNSPHPVIFLQHVPPDEFDNGRDFYERLAKMKMVSLVIHGHRHQPVNIEFPHGVPVLHMQALLFENEPPLPGGNIVTIEITPDKIAITPKALFGLCGNERTYRIDRKDLSLKGEPVFNGCTGLLKDPMPSQA